MSKDKKDKHTYNIEETHSEVVAAEENIDKHPLTDEEIEAMIPAEVTSPAMRTLIARSIKAKGSNIRYSDRVAGYYKDDIEG